MIGNGEDKSEDEAVPYAVKVEATEHEKLEKAIENTCGARRSPAAKRVALGVDSSKTEASAEQLKVGVLHLKGNCQEK